MSEELQPSAPTILCVDDEVNILSTLKRLLHKNGYQVLIAESATSALAMLEQHPVDMVISDMRMPEMDGAVFLGKVRERWPETVRLLLTGFADVQSIIQAINLGEIHRYIPKPWNEFELLLIVSRSLERVSLEREKRRLQDLLALRNEELSKFNAELESRVAERTEELNQANSKLKKNYLNSIKVFSSLIDLREGNLGGHSKIMADLARRTAKSMDLSAAQQQEIFVAALLHDIGKIGLLDDILRRPVARLSKEEFNLYKQHPVWGEMALVSQEDMQGVASLIRSHHERHDGNGFPDGLMGSEISLQASILIVVEAYLEMQEGSVSQAKLSAADARSMIAHGRGTQFNPEVVDVFLQVTLNAVPLGAVPCVMLPVAQLEPGMILGRDLVTKSGIVLLSAEHVLTDKLIRLLQQRDLRDGTGITLPIMENQKT